MVLKLINQYLRNEIMEQLKGGVLSGTVIIAENTICDQSLDLALTVCILFDLEASGKGINPPVFS